MSELKKITGSVIIRSFFGYDFTPKINNKESTVEIADITDDIVEYSFTPYYIFKTAFLWTHSDKIFRSAKERDIFRRVTELRDLARKTI